MLVRVCYLLGPVVSIEPSHSQLPASNTTFRSQTCIWITTILIVQRMGKFCRSRIPETLSKDLESVKVRLILLLSPIFLRKLLAPHKLSFSFKDNEEAVRKLGLKFGEEMCRQLLQLGARGLHFYTLNQLNPTTEILSALGFPAVASLADGR